MSRVSKLVVAVVLSFSAAVSVHAQPAAAAEPFAPVAQSPTAGTPVPGAFISTDLGTWNYPPDYYDFQWLRDGTPIAGATSVDYLIQPGDVGHQLAPYVVGHHGAETAHFTGSEVTVRKLTSELSLDVRRVHPRPDKHRLQWTAIAKLKTERPAITDGATVTAYKQKDGHLKVLASGTVTQGFAAVQLPWRRAPEGRTKVLVCFGGTSTVATGCSPFDVVNKHR